ncbi:MAG: hypothetical protein ACI4JB_10835 [Porcipelethomonas sp.]
MKMKSILIVILSVMVGLFVTGCFASCGSSKETDPEVEAYDRWWISTHDIFGNPR